MRFRKRPVVVEAWRWRGDVNDDNFPEWVKRYKSNNSRGATSFITLQKDKTLLIPTLEGDHTASIGDWIIRGVKGEVYPCKPDIFAATYEEAD